MLHTRWLLRGQLGVSPFFAIGRIGNKLWFQSRTNQCLKTGDYVEEFLVDSALTQTMECAV